MFTLFFAMMIIGQGLECSFQPEISASVAKYPYFVKNARYALNPALVRAIIHQESSGNPNAKSPVGARGLMQIMPGTAKILKCDFNRIEEPALNIACGTKFIAALLTYTNGDLVKTISAYNGGAHSTEKSPLLGGRIANNKETRNYVVFVLNLFEYYQKHSCQPSKSTPVVKNNSTPSIPLESSNDSQCVDPVSVSKKDSKTRNKSDSEVKNQ